MIAKQTATITVKRVRFRSTMCCPPCDAGVKPSPPKPVSRPECMSTSIQEDREQDVDDGHELEHALKDTRAWWSPLIPVSPSPA